MTEHTAADDRFRRAARHIGIAWLALVTLMLLSLGSSYLRLGTFNAVTGLVVASLKGAIVVWVFMRMRECGVLIRLAALAGLGLWAIQVTLTGVDYATRPAAVAPVENPQQLQRQPGPAAPPAR
jgi:caa(3)-type oxidase subunit IV